MGRPSTSLVLAAFSVVLIGSGSGDADLTQPLHPAPDAGEGRVFLRMHPDHAPLGFELERGTQRVRVFASDASEPARYDGDGVRDLEIVSWWGATGNIGYLVYLYDPAMRRFSHSPMYSDLSKPWPDRTGCVESGGVGGHAGAIYARDRRCPRDGALHPRFRERPRWDGDADHYVFTREEWSPDGTLEHVRIEHRRRGEGGLRAFQAEEFAEPDGDGCFLRTRYAEEDGSLVARDRARSCERPDPASE